MDFIVAPEGSETRKQLQFIVDSMTRYQSLDESDKKYCETDLAHVMVIDYIHHLNIGELTGTQTKEETKAIILEKNNAQNGEEENVARSKTETETLNVFAAIKELFCIKTEMNNSGLLSVQLVCRAHRVLLNSLHPNAGEIRTTTVYTRTKNTLHIYPDPTQAELLLFAIIDRHNIFVEGSPEDKQSIEYVTHVFKYAARLLFDFVDAHPFGDGNGRMCRLLANHAISHIIPFPVGIHHSKNPERSAREDYINAIVKCRENPKEGPRELCHMLIQGAIRGWKTLFDSLEKRDK